MTGDVWISETAYALVGMGSSDIATVLDYSYTTKQVYHMTEKCNGDTIFSYLLSQ